MNKIEVSAKTVDEAVRNALITLGISQEDAIIEVIEEGSRGIFGLGGRDAKVTVAAKEKDSSVDIAKKFTDELISKMHLDCVADVSEDSEAIKIVITGDGVGGIIGRRGETLDAVQYLVNLRVNKGKHGDDYKRVIIDSENYRAKREETLVHLAQSMASKAVKYRKEMAFEPMNPYERRIIHASLQGHSGVTTRSIGEDPNRKIIISPK